MYFNDRDAIVYNVPNKKRKGNLIISGGGWINK